ncbi:MAG: guanine deaminase [Elusimicrobia bacterium]|nr:guanine deaminase [Elusimicrobiota bacterium]
MLTRRVKAPLLFLEDGAIEVDNAGVIRRVGRFDLICAGKSGKKGVLDYRGRLILPGLIDGHCHLPQYAATAKDGLELLGWLKTNIFPLERSFHSAPWVRPYARHFFQELLRNGTTTAAIYTSIWKDSTDICFEEALKSGMRVIMGQVMMDRLSYDDVLRRPASQSFGDGDRDSVPGRLSPWDRLKKIIQESEGLCHKWHGKENRLFYAFSPRFGPSCSPALLRQAGRLAKKYSAYIQTHLAENRQEVGVVLKANPQCRSYTDFYHQSGILGPKTLLGHCIWLDGREMDILNKTAGKVIHCPTSNFFLSSGIMDWNGLAGRNIPIALGSDVGAGPELSIWAVMKQALYADKIAGAYHLHEKVDNKRPLTVQGVFYWATLGGAKALGMDNVTGSLEPGKQADFIVADPLAVNPMPGRLSRLAGRSAQSHLARLIYRGGENAVCSVFVKGRKLFEAAPKN